MKVIGLGPSRTGTMGLWLSLRILGYNPHHIGDSLRAGVEQMKALEEAITAADTAEPLTQSEIAKIWGDYDANPDIKFILNERSPESFLKSLSGAQCRYWTNLSSWKLFLARLTDPFLWHLERILRIQILRWSGGVKPRDPSFEANVLKNYIE
ncbi:hypothetical protein DHEL01_v203491 [Diaporthe helianthi]|uniref:NAD dependent epimerase/dehydratase n=1 Tax=Diaporthe helianthi TaxID=158607 RepID=A0A2P5I6H7_DIAHE|nr:hypothetical protein DHEL01_v203491 [Diaporthe helianthi]